MKAEISRQIPLKHVAMLELVLLSSINGVNNRYCCFLQMLTFERTPRQVKGEQFLSRKYVVTQQLDAPAEPSPSPKYISLQLQDTRV